MYKFTVMFFILLLSGCASQSSPEQDINLTILVDGSAEDALPSDNRSLKALVNNTADQLDAEGINVYDLARSSGRSTEMDKAELIDFARGYRAAALDYVVVLSVDALIEPKINRTNIETFINGQVIQLGSGRVSGAFSIDGRQVNATKNCRRSCVSDGLRRSLVSLDGELSAEILSALAKPVKVKGKVARSEQISSEGPSASQYTLIFDGFSQDDMLDIEHYLEIFSGYKSLHYRTSERRYSELDYRAQISRAKLTRNLNRVLSELSMDGAVKVTGDTVKITKLQQKSSTKFDTEGWE